MTSPYQGIKETGILFHSLTDKYSYASLCLADGLNQLGIPIFSHLTSYQDNLVSDFKFRKMSELEFADLGEPKYIVIDISSIEGIYLLNLDIPTDKIVIALSISDTVSTIVLKNDIPFFCGHENKFFEFSDARMPWAFGISSKMIELSQDNNFSIDRREKKFVYNFRPSGNQSVRECLDLILIPQLEKYFSLDTEIISQVRWDENNFERLKKNFGCLAYGGNFMQNLVENPQFASKEPYYLVYKEINFVRKTTIERWDSWRFWESLAAGCLTIHLDFEKYGFNLPVMPTNWEHYIGLNLEDIKGDIERLMDERDRLPEIAINGKTWALEHYSPVAVAKRFLLFLEEYTELLETLDEFS